MSAMDERKLADRLRFAAKLSSPKRLPEVGDIVQVGNEIGICTEYHKGWCYVRAFDENNELARWLDFPADEERHGPSQVAFIIRDDLRDPKEASG